MSASNVSDRDIRAVSEYMTVVEVGDELFEVYSENGDQYLVDTTGDEVVCNCPDYRYRADEIGLCKHARRVLYSHGDVDTDALRDKIRDEVERLEAQAFELESKAQDLRHALDRLDEVEHGGDA